MVQEERIDQLVSAFGQTISDLPKASVTSPEMYVYSRRQMGSANMDAWRWHRTSGDGALDCEDYICHLTDVIDRMAAALETAQSMTRKEAGS